MADLLVREVDDEVFGALKELAGANGRSAEAEHRVILATALSQAPTCRGFADSLTSMPNVGMDADFERP